MSGVSNQFVDLGSRFPNYSESGPIVQWQNAGLQNQRPRFEPSWARHTKTPHLSEVFQYGGPTKRICLRMQTGARARRRCVLFYDLQSEEIKQPQRVLKQQVSNPRGPAQIYKKLSQDSFLYIQAGPSTVRGTVRSGFEALQRYLFE